MSKKEEYNLDILLKKIQFKINKDGNSKLLTNEGLTAV